MQRIFLAAFRMFKHKKSLYQTTKYSLSTNNTPRSFFKKREQIKTISAQPPIQVQSKIKNQSILNDEEIKRNLQDYSSYFNQQRSKLPMFLRKLTKCMSHSVFLKYEQQFTNIYYRINKYSSQLVLKPHQFLEIIIFLQRYIDCYSKQHPIETLNVTNGFEHRATILAATFVYNGQFSLTQSIAVFQILTKIGSISMLFLTNLTKVLKTQFQSQKSKERIRLQHILTILNTYFIKSNHTILENVLYDMTLNYLLKHSNLVNEVPIVFKIDVLSLLLRMDLMNFYLSDRNQLREMLLRLIDQVLPIIKSSTFKLDEVQDSDHTISLRQAVYLIEGCDQFIPRTTKGFIQSKINGLAESICDQGLKSIDLYQRDINQMDGYLLVSIVFNRHNKLTPSNMKKPIELIKRNLKYLKHQDFKPIIQIYDQSQEKRFLIAQFINQLYKQAVKNGFFSPLIFKLALDTALSQNIPQIVDDLALIYHIKQSKLNKKDRFVMLELMYYAGVKNPSTLQETKCIKLLQILQAEINEHSKNKVLFIRQLQQALLLLYDRSLNSIIFHKLFQGDKLKEYLKLPHQNQFERNEYQMACLHIYAELVSHDLAQLKTETLQEFGEHIIYQFLVSLYPQKHLNVRKTLKSLRILEEEDAFIKNMEIIISLASKIQKFGYLIWDIFMNNYRLRSKSTREAAFTILKRLFLNAFQKEKARKVVVFTSLMNFMASGIIVAPMQQKKQLFEACLKQLVEQNMQEKFHYHCFLQITFNARSIGVLSDQMFTMIVRRYLAASKNAESSFKTSLLLLLYGMNMKTSQKNIYKDQYEQQARYIQILLNKDYIMIPSRKQAYQSKSIGNQSKNTVIARGKYISVLLSYGGKEILKVGNAILTFVEECDDYCEFMMVLNSFQIETFDLENQSIKKFVMKLNDAFLNKIEYFHGQQILSTHDYQSILKTVSSNRSRLNDCSK